MTTPWFMYNKNKGYGVYNNAFHDGWDFGAPSHTPVTSLSGGTVMPHTGWYPWGGEVDIKGGNAGPGVTETVAHLDRIDVHPRQVIKPGQQVGLSGGENLPKKYSTGPHIHYSLFGGAPWDNKQSIDPGGFIDSAKKNLGIGNAAVSTGVDPTDTAAAIGFAIGKAYQQAEDALSKTIKRAAYFIIGLLLIAAGILLTVIAASRTTARAATPYIPGAGGQIARAMK